MDNWRITARDLEGYFDLHGRSTRADYWWFYLLSSLGSLLLGLSAGASFGTPLAAPMELLLVSYTVLIVPPQIAVGARRMRDVGRSGWWILAPRHDHWDPSLSLFLFETVAGGQVRILTCLCLLAWSMLLPDRQWLLAAGLLKTWLRRQKSQVATLSGQSIFINSSTNARRRAAAANNLGTLYLDGYGVSQNTQTALFYFIRSAESWASNVISLEVAGALLKLQLGGFTSQENIPMLLEIE